MTKAQTPTAAWHAVIESLEREKVLKIADLKKSIQLAIEKEKDEAKATSSPSILDPILTKSTISREKHLAEENTRQSAVEQIQKEVQSGKRRVLVLADMGNGNARHISGATLPVLMQDFSKCMNGEKFGFVDCSQCDVTMTSAKNLNNHLGGRLLCGPPFCLGYREAKAAVEAGDMTKKHLAMRHHQRIQSM